MRDASEFMVKFEPAITASAPHVYISALAFAPEGSSIARIYGPRFRRSLSLWSERMTDGNQSTSSDPFDVVSWISFFANGQYFLSGSRDGFIRIFNEYGPTPSVDYPRDIRLPKDMRNISSLAVTNDVSILAACSVGGKLAIWEIDTDEGSLRFLCDSNVSKPCSLVFAPRGGRSLASSSRDGTVSFWSITVDGLRNRFGPLLKHRAKKAVNAIAFSPDGSRLVSGSDDRTLIIWNVEMGEIVDQQLFGHEGPVISVAWSSDGFFIASGSKDCTVRTWDSTGNSINTIEIFSPTKLASSVFAVAFSPDARTIISSTGDKTVRFWDRKSCEPAGETIPTSYPVRALAFSPNREHMVALQSDSSMHLWSAAEGIFHSEGPFNKDANDDFLSLSFGKDGQQIVTGTAGGYVHLWDIQSRKCLGMCHVCGSPIESVRVVPKTNYIIAFSNNTARKINLLSGQLAVENLPKKLERRTDRIVNRLRREHFCRRSLNQKLRRPDFKDGDGEYHNVRAVSPDGCTVVFALRTALGGVLRLWSVGERFELHGELDHSVVCIAFSPDGKNVASGTEDALQLWKVQGKSRFPHRVGLPLKAFGVHEKLIAVTFSPDGKRLATVSTGKIIRIWELVMKNGVPVALNEGRTSASAGTVIPVSFNERGEPTRVGIADGSGILKTQFAFLDGKQRPAIGDWSYIDEYGWVRNGYDSEGYDHLQFWLPPENRGGFWWPRNSAVIGKNVTRVNFSQFMRGGEWQSSRTIVGTDEGNLEENRDA